MPREAAASLPEPVFSEVTPAPDPSTFTVTPDDQRLYQGIEDLLKKDVVGFDRSRAADQDVFPLERALGSRGPAARAAIQAAGRMVFHAVGDSGAASTRSFPAEIKVTDALCADFHAAAAADRPAFLFHLGDLVYNFGESAYYYDQFYDPFRDYAAPIFAVPGNHDSFVVPNTPAGSEPLRVFSRNFCAQSPVVTPEAGSLHRTAMTQPGVYFSLDAPFVRIIGLFSNALEDPGVISSENGRWGSVPDYQLDFLRAQLRRVTSERYAGALILAVHHPPFSWAPANAAPSGRHGGSPAMLAQVDAICLEENVYPHVVLSGHAHNYQRFTRKLDFGGKQLSVPFVVCGSGGHNVNPLVSARGGTGASEPADGADASHLDSSTVVRGLGLVLDRHDQANYGYLKVIADARSLTVEFHPVTPHAAPLDSLTVDLAAHTSRTVGAARTREPARRSAKGGKAARATSAARATKATKATRAAKAARGQRPRRNPR